MKPEKYYQMIRIQLKCMIMLNKSMTLEFHEASRDSLNKRYQIDQKTTIYGQLKISHVMVVLLQE